MMQQKQVHSSFKRLTHASYLRHDNTTTLVAIITFFHTKIYSLFISTQFRIQMFHVNITKGKDFKLELTKP